MKKFKTLFLIITLILFFNHSFPNNIRTLFQNVLTFNYANILITEVDLEEENDIYAVRV